IFLYAPHAIRTDIFRPPEDRKALRQAMGLDDFFVIFMNFANYSKDRKGTTEQFTAFAKFAQKHDDARLLCHTVPDARQGVNLHNLTARLGISEKVMYSSQYLMATGMIPAEDVRGSYGAADVYSGCSLGEGFGLPIMEANACATPPVVTDHSAMPEVGG